MAKEHPLSIAEIKSALSELDSLCRAEYGGLSLHELLLDKDGMAALRLQRLTGIALKKEFAVPVAISGPSLTGASRAWPWKKSAPEDSAANAPREYALLDQLRKHGSWDGEHPLTWDQFKDDIEHERGLFKALALYLADQVSGRERKTLREYLDTGESRRFEAGLDLAVLLADAAVMGPIAAVLGLPTVAVGVALVSIQYGWRYVTDPDAGRAGDRSN